MGMISDCERHPAFFLSRGSVFSSLSVEPKSGKQSAMSIAFGFKVLKFSFQMDFIYWVFFYFLFEKKGKTSAAYIINYQTLVIGSDNHTQS